MESDDSEALIKLLINISTRELTIIEDLREFNRQQIALNERVALMLAELIRQRRNGNPN